jgi:cell division protein FtsW (lipid II flippase)
LSLETAATGAALPDPVGDMSSILLLVISLIAPWVVQLAPPRQRLVAVVAVVAVLLLFGVFSANPLRMWQLWIGLIIGILSVVLFVNMGSRPGGRRRWEDEEEADPTGEL